MRPCLPHHTRLLSAVTFVLVATLLHTGHDTRLNAQSGPPPLTPFRGLTDRASASVWGDTPAQGHTAPGRHAISGDGRYVAMQSSAYDLVNDDWNWTDDVFLRDRTTGTTTLVSVAPDGSSANGWSMWPSISTNGRHVAFTSGATNLIAADTNDRADIFVRDLDEGRTVRVSVATDGTPADGDSYLPTISATGRFVAFTSTALTLVPGGDPNQGAQVYLHDRDADANGIFDEAGGTSTTMVSVSMTGGGANSYSGAVRVSADGRYVAFDSGATNLVETGNPNFNNHLFLRDRQTNETSIVDRTLTGAPSGWGIDFETSDMTDDGRFFTYASVSYDILDSPYWNGESQIYRYDAATATTVLVSALADGTHGDRASFSSSISSDGRHVAFTTQAYNLATPPPPGQNYGSLIVRDMVDGTFTRVDVNSAGDAFNHNYAYAPSMSADGTAVAFQSDASNVDGQYGYWYQVYVATAFSIDTSSASYPMSGGSGAIEVNTTALSGWRARSLDPWITITAGGAYGAGPRTVEYTVEENYDGIVRDGRILVGSTMVAIHQDGDGDTTPPVITPIVTGTMGGDGWYVSNVTVQFSVTDPDSAIVSQSYNCTNPVTIAIDTLYAPVTCEATSHGGTTSHTVVIKRDTTGPAITITTPGNTMYPNGAYVSAQWSCPDANGYSGTLTCPITQGSSPIDTTPGPHTFTITATDRAGNTSTKSVTYFVGTGVCVPPNETLSMWWRFQNDMFDALKDSYAIPTPDTMTPVYENGMAGRAWKAQPQSNQYLTTMEYNQAALWDGLTVAAWIRPNGALGQSATIVSKPAMYRIARYPDSTLRYAFSRSTGYVWVNTGIQLANNVWTHLAITYDTAGAVKTYINGSLAHTHQLTGTQVDSGDYGAPLTIGGRPDLTAAYFGGIDELEIYKSAISATEISTLFNSGSGSTCLPLATTMTVTVPETVPYGPNFPVSVTLRDSNNNPVPDQWINLMSFVKDPPGYTGGGACTTDSNGACSTTATMNASAVAGTYTPGVSGFYAGTVHYKPAGASTSVTVVPATPTMGWGVPAPIVYGTALGAAQLNATASVPGTFQYTPAAGATLNAGTHLLSVLFTPTDTARWSTATATTLLTVDKATPAVTISSAPLFYTGQPRTASVTVTGVGGVELNPFTVLYNGSSTLPVNAGTYAVQVSYGGSANYDAVTVGGSLVINKAAPIFPTINDLTETYDGLTHGWSVNVAGVNGEWLTPVVHTYNGSTTVPTNAGVYAFEASYAGSANYLAGSRTATLTILKAAPSLTWPNPSSIVYGTALSGTQLNATANVAGTFDYSPASGTVLNTGAHTLTATFTPSDATNYQTASASRPLTVTKANAQITWFPPAAIDYGTALSATQLNATANTTGTFEYSHAVGTVLNAGQTIVSVNFTPDDPANYNAANASVPVTVTKATPAVSWNNPADVVYGTALGAAQLNATVSVPGTFAYSPAAGTVPGAGAHTLSVTFSPDDAANYNAATATVSLNVAKADSTITWNNPADIVYGTALGGAQLNATASVAGTFSYSPAAGSVLNAGAQTLSVTFTPTDAANYNGASSSVTLNIAKATSTISWSNPANIFYGTPLGGTQLNATANVAGTFSYSPATGTVLTAGFHTLSVTFTPDDAGNYDSASASATINVARAASTISWSNPADVVFGTSLGASQLNATASVPGTFEYSPAAGTVLGAGVQTLTVIFTPADTANYYGAAANVTLNVAKAASSVTWTNPTDIVYGTALGASQLNATANVAGTFSYSPASGTVLSAGSQTLSVTFTPEDAANYDGASASVTLNVTKAASSVTWSNPADVVYGTALGASQLNATANVAGTFSYSPVAGTVLNAGSQPLSVTFTPDDAANYDGSSSSVTLNVTKAASSITWANPADVVYGTALGASQLNATASVAGTFSYSPASGTLLNAGAQTLSVTFTPDDAANYNGSSSSVTLTVTKAASSISWANPASIVYGTALGASQLNATANVAGTFAYSPASGTILGAGSHSLSVTFTPADAANYNGSSASQSLTVTAAPLTVTAGNASKPFGAPLPPFSASGAGFVNGDSMASLSGTLSFSTSATASSAVGGYPVTPSAVSSPNYAIAFVNGTLTIVPASTTTSVSASPNPDGLNQAVTFTAAVAVVAPGAGSPAGVVQFFEGSTLLGSVSLASGTATLTTNGFTAGGHAITATYTGDASFAASSGNGGFTVNSGATSSSTVVTASANPSTAGQNVTFTATVTAPAGLSGSVGFYDGTTLLATQPLSANKATFTTSALATGGHAITARYLGNATIPPSTSPAFAHFVKPAGTNPKNSTAAVTASPSPATLGSNVTFTATITGAQNKAPSGQVTFFVNGSVVGQGTLTTTGSITAATTFSVSTLPHGTHKVEVVYLGDATFRASAASVNLVVN